MNIVEPAENIEITLQQLPDFNPDKKYVLKDLLSGKIYSREGRTLKVSLAAGKSHIFKVEQSWG
jgi:hypothetical protein